MPSSTFWQFVGGLTFFFFGLFTIHQGLQFFAGDRLQQMVARTTQGPIRSLLTGIIVTFFLQSSSAVTVMTVGLTSSGLITLRRAMAVALGAGIGTTLVVFLFSLKTLVTYGIVIVILGMSWRFISDSKSQKQIGEIIYGFGFVFFGLTVMSQATAPLKENEIVIQALTFIASYKVASFVVAAVLTALIHSSSVILGILVSLAYAGSITIEAALPLILGANVGTSFTALTISLKSKTDGKRVAWANLAMRLGAALIFVVFSQAFISLAHQSNIILLQQVFRIPIEPYFEISLFHFYYNLLAALIFLPLIPVGEKIVTKLIPKDPSEEKSFGPKYLEKSALNTPSLAISQVHRELIRMGELLQVMFEDIHLLLKSYNLELQDRIKANEHKIDILHRAIKFYLAQLTSNNLNNEEVSKAMYLMRASNEIENIGDTLDHHFVKLAHTKWNKAVRFSDEGWAEIREMHDGTLELIKLTMAALSTSSQDLAIKVANHQIYFSERSDQLKMSHLARLNKGLQESLDTSAMHLELLSLYHRINLLLLTMVSHLVPERAFSNSGVKS